MTTISSNVTQLLVDWRNGNEAAFERWARAAWAKFIAPATRGWIGRSPSKFCRRSWPRTPTRWLRVKPRFDALRSDPRFKQWLQRMKLD